MNFHIRHIRVCWLVYAHMQINGDAPTDDESIKNVFTTWVIYIQNDSSTSAMYLDADINENIGTCRGIPVCATIYLYIYIIL